LKRKTKNIIVIFLIVIVGIFSFITMNLAKNSTNVSTNEKMDFKGGTPPEMPSNSQNSQSSDTNNLDSSTTQDSTGNMGEPPSGNMGEPPSGNMGEPPSGNMGDNKKVNKTNDLENIYYIAFGIESLIIIILITYLIASKFNKKSIKEIFYNFDKAVIYIISVVVLTTGLTGIDTYVTKNYFLENDEKQLENKNNTTNTVSSSGATEVDDTDETLTETYSSTNSDESSILVKNSGNLTLKNATVNKTSGDSTNTENSEFYGINSAILVTANSTATINNTTINASTKGSNAVFSTGTNSKIYINNSTITTTGTSSSRGLDATYGGYIEANKVNITTQGGSCATLATDRGEGTVIAKNSKLETNGSGSPLIYSTGDITISNTTGTANKSQMVVVEGKNSATITDSTITASGQGNRNDVDNSGIMIYQSMSGDSTVGTGNFSATDSNLSILSSSSYYKTAPMFFVTNTDAVINLTNTKLVYGSNILISAKGTTEWGTTGSNGGDVTLNAISQTLVGDIYIDNISTLNMNLKNSTSYKGTINEDNSAKSITLKLDKSSNIILTGDSYLTSLEDADTTYSNIDFNGYKLYVNGESIN